MLWAETTTSQKKKKKKIPRRHPATQRGPNKAMCGLNLALHSVSFSHLYHLQHLPGDHLQDTHYVLRVPPLLLITPLWFFSFSLGSVIFTAAANANETTVASARECLTPPVFALQGRSL